MNTDQNRDDFIEEMEDILCPYKDLEVGHDDFVYGSYVEWPPLDTCDDEQIDLLLRYFDIEIPFGETWSVEDLVTRAFGVGFDIVSSINADDKELTFHNFEDAKPEILEYLRGRNVPEGAVYEYDMGDNYPDHMKYFTSKHLWDDQELDYYTQEPITLTKYLKHIEDAKISFAKTNDTLAKCSLILSALIFAECYVKSAIVNELNSALSAISRIFDLRTFMNHTHKQLRTVEGRNYFYRLLNSGQKLGNLPWTDIRNSLAHSLDAAECKVENGKEILVYLDRNNEEASADVEVIFKDLSSFRMPSHMEGNKPASN